MEVRAEAAEVGDHALGGQRLEPAHRLGGVGLVVEQDQLERHLLAAHGDAAGGVDLLDGDLVAGAHLGAARAVAAGERDDGADLDGLRPRGGRSQPSSARASRSQDLIDLLL